MEPQTRKLLYVTAYAAKSIAAERLVSKYTILLPDSGIAATHIYLRVDDDIFFEQGLTETKSGPDHWMCCIPEIWTCLSSKIVNGRCLQPGAERKNHSFGCYKYYGCDITSPPGCSAAYTTVYARTGVKAGFSPLSGERNRSHMPYDPMYTACEFPVGLAVKS